MSEKSDKSDKAEKSDKPEKSEAVEDSGSKKSNADEGSKKNEELSEKEVSENMDSENDTTEESTTDLKSSAISSTADKSDKSDKSDKPSEKPTSTTAEKKEEKPTEKKSGKKSKSNRKSLESKQSSVSSTENKQTSTIDRKKSKSSTRGKIDDLSQVKIGFVGAGRMTESIVRGLLKSEKVVSKQLYVSARSTKNFETFKSLGLTTSTRPYEIFAKLDCDVIFLCMHGFVIRNCFKMGGTRPFPFTTNYIPWKRKQVSILSLVGGIPVNDIRVTLLNPEQTQKYQVTINRLMINASVAYNLGYGLLDVELDSKKCPTVVRDILQLLGKFEYLDSSLMDAACALGGNGLAFVYYFITALADGGFKMGITRERAVKLACKTVQSAAFSVLESNKTPMDLRDDTAGPSGPAIYGMNVMDKKDFGGGISLAIETAYKRILELCECETK